MTVGYLILAHREPRQIIRLLRTIRRQSAGPVVVHVDRKAGGVLRKVRAAVADLKDIAVISSRSVHWGGFSIVQAALDGARELLTRWPDVSHVKHLSGQDYPLRPLHEFEAYAAQLGGRSALEFHAMPTAEWGPEGGMERLNRYWIYTGKRRVALPFARRRIPAADYYGGSAFWCLSRPHLEFVLNRDDALSAVFQRSFISDETYFPTLLMNSPFHAELLNTPLTFTVWRQRSPSPDPLTYYDRHEAAASGSFFGRKFDPFLSVELMDWLDASVASPT